MSRRSRLSAPSLLLPVVGRGDFELARMMRCLPPVAHSIHIHARPPQPRSPTARQRRRRRLLHTGTNDVVSVNSSTTTESALDRPIDATTRRRHRLSYTHTHPALHHTQQACRARWEGGSCRAGRRSVVCRVCVSTCGRASERAISVVCGIQDWLHQVPHPIHRITPKPQRGGWRVPIALSQPEKRL